MYAIMCCDGRKPAAYGTLEQRPGMQAKEMEEVPWSGGHVKFFCHSGKVLTELKEEWMLDSAWFQKSQFCNKARGGGTVWRRGYSPHGVRKQEETGQGSKDKMYPAEPHH